MIPRGTTLPPGAKGGATRAGHRPRRARRGLRDAGAREPRRLCRGFAAPVAIAVLVAGSVAASPAQARTCCGKLSGHLYALHDTFEAGAELRSFYFGASVGDGLPTSRAQPERVYENNLMLALRPALSWFPLNGLTVSFEGELRYRRPGWQANAVPGLDLRLVHGAASYDAGWIEVTAGVHQQHFGTAAALDQRLLGVTAEHKRDWGALAAFGGVTSRWLMKNAGDCLWMRYASDNIGWKTVSTRLEENVLAGLSATLRRTKPYRLALLYLFASPSVEALRGHLFSGFFGGPIVRPYLDFDLELLAQVKHSGSFLPAVVALLRGRLGDGPTRPRLTVGVASSFGEREDRRFASVLENLSWGLVRRFSLFHGHVFTARAAWPLSRHVQPFVDFFAQTFAMSSADLSDELDAGVWVALSDLYRLRVAYVGMNITTSWQAPSHALYAELRLILGS